MTWEIMGKSGLLHGHNANDDNGMPLGGIAQGSGVQITWQRGAIVDPDSGTRRQPNGAFVEDVLEICAQRLRYYNGMTKGENGGQFRSRQTEIAITKIEEAILWLGHRAQDRTRRGVEGTHET